MPTPPPNNSDKPGGALPASRGTTAVFSDRATDGLNRWVDEIGGRQRLADVLILADLNPRLLHFVRLLTGARHQEHTLFRLLAEANLSAHEVMLAYKKTAFLRGQTVAIHKTAEAMPQLIAQLTAEAVDHMDVCMRCKGTGGVKKKPRKPDDVLNPVLIDCPTCHGTGEVFVEADEKAQQKLINILQLGPKQTTITAVKVDMPGHGGSGDFSAMMKDSDEAARAIEGELVPEDLAQDSQEPYPDVPPEGGGRPPGQADDANPS